MGGIRPCVGLLAAALTMSAAIVFSASAPARPLNSIRERGSLVLCANPNALPFSSRNGEKRGFQLELGEALAKELGVGFEVGWVIFANQVPRVNCDILLDTIVDQEIAAASHMRLSRPYNESGVAIALRQGLGGIGSYDDLKGKKLRVGAMVGSVASVTLGEQGLRTIPFAFEDEMIEAVGKGELDAALVTPVSIGYYNLTHREAPVSFVRAFEAMPLLHWSLAVGMRHADDALVAAVNQALDRMLAQGVVKRIYAGYGIEQRLPQP